MRAPPSPANEFSLTKTKKCRYFYTFVVCVCDLIPLIHKMADSFAALRDRLFTVALRQVKKEEATPLKVDTHSIGL